MKMREMVERRRGKPASDGAGVRLMRVFGGGDSERFDPFLMLDEFGSDKPEDYSGGFPAHPHRGFETVTYMLAGTMEHRDHLGNVGVLASGGVQWMTAGRGIVHSEMPLQEAGLMRGFQLWVNLPAAEKMKPAGYRDVPPEDIPDYELSGARVRAIAGAVTVDGRSLEGFFPRDGREIDVFDIALDGEKPLVVDTDAGHRVLLYCFEGALQVGGSCDVLNAHELALLSDGEGVALQAEGPARCLLLSGRPIGEPIVQYGPMVMNSREEIEQALADYREGRFVTPTE